MKKSNQFYYYAWLINLIAERNGITFEEINRHWIKDEMNDGTELTRHTFIRYKRDIEHIFSIDIECDRKSNKYFIHNLQTLHNNSVQRWMLSTLSVSDVISRSLSLQDRIILENIPIEGKILRDIIDAMRHKRRISFFYKKYKDSIPSQRLITPC